VYFIEYTFLKKYAYRLYKNEESLAGKIKWVFLEGTLFPSWEFYCKKGYFMIQVFFQHLCVHHSVKICVNFDEMLKDFRRRIIGYVFTYLFKISNPKVSTEKGNWWQKSMENLVKAFWHSETGKWKIGIVFKRIFPGDFLGI
jgi:hypothetical protein